MDNFNLCGRAGNPLYLILLQSKLPQKIKRNPKTFLEDYQIAFSYQSPSSVYQFGHIKIMIEEQENTVMKM